MTRHSILAIAAAMLTTIAMLSASPVFATDGVATLGSPPPEEEQANVATPPEDPMDAMLDFVACMREHGVEMPDPQGSGAGVVMTFEATGDVDDPSAFMDETFLAAEEACREHLGTMAARSDPALEAEIMEGLLAYADCMRDNGIDMPDPVLQDGGFMVGSAGGDDGADVIDFFSDEFMAAEEACRDVMPFDDLGPAGGVSP